MIVGVNVHLDEKTTAEVLEHDNHVCVCVDGYRVTIYLPKSRIDDARRIARAINNTGDE